MATLNPSKSTQISVQIDDPTPITQLRTPWVVHIAALIRLVHNNNYDAMHAEVMQEPKSILMIMNSGVFYSPHSIYSIESLTSLQSVNWRSKGVDKVCPRGESEV